MKDFFFVALTRDRRSFYQTFHHTYIDTIPKSRAPSSRLSPLSGPAPSQIADVGRLAMSSDLDRWCGGQAFMKKHLPQQRAASVLGRRAQLAPA